MKQSIPAIIVKNPEGRWLLLDAGIHGDLKERALDVLHQSDLAGLPILEINALIEWRHPNALEPIASVEDFEIEEDPV